MYTRNTTTIPACSIAPSNAIGLDDISRLLSSSYQSQGAILSPSFSFFTGLNGPRMPADPTISASMRKIINSAVGVARNELERERERAWSSFSKPIAGYCGSSTSHVDRSLDPVHVTPDRIHILKNPDRIYNTDLRQPHLRIQEYKDSARIFFGGGTNVENANGRR